MRRDKYLEPVGGQEEGDPREEAKGRTVFAALDGAVSVRECIRRNEICEGKA
jgi:hypothetical protein